MFITRQIKQLPTEQSIIPSNKESIHYNKALLDLKLNHGNLTYEQRVSALTSRLDYKISNSNYDINNQFKGDRIKLKRLNSYNDINAKTQTSFNKSNMNMTKTSLNQSSMKKIDINTSK